MKLSVLIVNHNAGERLRVSLISLLRAGRNIDHEIIIVDNESSDRSFEMLNDEFPHVQIIINEKKVGLSTAFNQGIKASKGDYILIANPYILSKTITLEKITGFMDEHPDAGGLSVRMVDLHGNYLPESKRSLPAAWCNFFKYTGLSRYFPKSCFPVNKSEDWVEEFETTEVDVLNGACMLLRRSVLNKTGLFDERFYRYGQDIDLSYRIRLEGFKNFYYSHTFVVQVRRKGAVKFSWNYIKHYYGAMFIFAAKYLFKLPVLTLNDMGALYPTSYEVER